MARKKAIDPGSGIPITPGSLEGYEAFLVEFNKNGKAKKNECEWLGVLYPAEIEVVETQPSA